MLATLALTAALVLSQGQAEAAPAEGMNGLDCSMPQGFPAYEHEVTFMPASAPNALEAAYVAAGEKLLRRVCQGKDCPAVRQQMKQWKNGRLKGDLCAMVVVPKAAIAEFIRVQREAIEAVSTEKLGQQFSEVLQRLFRRELQEGKQLVLAVTIDKIEVDQNNGGPAAEFLKTHMASSLSTLDAFVLKDPPNPFDGRGLPKGFDAILTAKALTRNEKSTEVVDVAWSALISDPRVGQRRESAQPVAIPAAALPRGEQTEEEGGGLRIPPSQSATMTVRLDTRSGGSLCTGDLTNLHVSSTTRRTRQVQIFNLFGEGEASLLYSGPLAGNRTLSAGGPQGFQAYPLENPEEAFLVVASDKPAPVVPLAKFQAMSGSETTVQQPCRLKPEQAKKVWDWHKLPRQLTVVGDGYRIISGDGCPKVETYTDEQLRQAVEGMELCDELGRKAVATPIH